MGINNSLPLSISILDDPRIADKIRKVEASVDKDDGLEVQFVRRNGGLFSVRVTCDFRPKGGNGNAKE